MKFEVIYEFNGHDGETPFGTLIQAADGYLYGTAKFGGARKRGVIYRVNLDGTNFQVIHDFAGGREDGAYPGVGVVQGSDGALYGVTRSGGCWKPKGVAYKVNPDGSGFQMLHKFTARRNDGQFPRAGVIQGKDGALCGTTIYGGAHDHGAVYRMNADGTGFRVLHSFALEGGEGAFPESPLLQGKDGALYGTTAVGGVFQMGLVFKMNPDGSDYQVLHSFAGGERVGCQFGGLIQGPDGVLYGAATYRGARNQGYVYKVNPDGSDFMVLYDFGGYPKDGGHPWEPPILASDGALYGTTAGGGEDDKGTIYRLNTDGSDYEILYVFEGGANECWNGCWPSSGLIQASDGALYGTASGGGTSNKGVIFRIELD